MSSSTTGSIVSWLWNFGDPASGAANTYAYANPSHLFTSQGLFNVKLRVTDNAGYSDSLTLQVDVKLLPAVNYPPFSPVCQFTPVQAATAFVANGVTGTGVYSGGIDSNGMYMADTFYYHTFTYTFTTTQGCATTVSQILQVDPRPEAIFSVNDVQQCLGNNLFAVTNTSSIPGGGGMFVDWSFGDGNVSSFTNPTHTYTQAGVYNMVLIIGGGSGCKDTAMQTVRVSSASFSSHDTAICQSSLPFFWSNHTYYSAGTYSDTTVNAAGCDSIKTLTLTLLTTPNPIFTESYIDSFCAMRMVAFIATANANYLWNFGDGDTSTVMNPVHVYPAAGTYLPTLSVSNNCGSSTTTGTVYIAPENKTILPAIPATLVANRQCDADSGWTNYYYDNNTPGYAGDDTLLLSLKLNGNNIGYIGDGTFQLKQIATAGAGSNTGILLTNPLITNPSGYWVMNRYWNVLPTLQPVTTVGVRFYFNTQDLNDVNGSYSAHNLNYNDLIFYKTLGGNPDPTTNLAGATGITTILNGSFADTTHWVYTALSATSHIAEFRVSHFSGGGGGATGNGQVLPQRLISFDALRKGQSNLLTWTTCAQVKAFQIQRSSSTLSFVSIGNVAAQNGACRQYTFNDNEPLNGANYYRLKMIDNDGKVNYSAIRTVMNNGSVNVVVYPNPVKDVLSLQLTSDRNKDIQLQVIDIEGKILRTIKTTATQGTTIKAIDMPAIKAGSYFLKLTSSDESVVVKFEKL